MQWFCATDLADKGLSVVRLRIPGGWEDASVIMANCYSGMAPPSFRCVAYYKCGINDVFMALDLAPHGALAYSQFSK